MKKGLILLILGLVLTITGCVKKQETTSDYVKAEAIIQKETANVSMGTAKKEIQNLVATEADTGCLTIDDYYKTFNFDMSSMEYPIEVKTHNYCGDLLVDMVEDYKVIEYSFVDSEVSAKGEIGVVLENTEDLNRAYYRQNFGDSGVSDNLFYLEPTDEIIDCINTVVNSFVNDDIKYVKYIGEKEEDGRKYDVVEVQGTQSDSMRDIDMTMEAWIDKDTNKLSKLIKQADKNNDYDFSMSIESINEFLEPTWVLDCRQEGTDDDSYRFLGLFMDFMLLTDDGFMAKSFDDTAEINAIMETKDGSTEVLKPEASYKMNSKGEWEQTK